MDRGNILKPEYDLFNGRFGYLSLKDWKKYFFRRRWLLKNGYPYIATWEFYETFRVSMSKALREFNSKKIGNPAYLTFEQWTEKLNEIADLLDASDEQNEQYKYMYYGEQNELTTAAKNKALDMLKEHWWHLWD